MRLFSIIPKRAVGIDIGTSAIKVLELSSVAGKVKLENYAQFSFKNVSKSFFSSFQKGSVLFSTKSIVEALKKLLLAAKIQPKNAFFSIPDFATFFATFSLPPMTKQEIPFAVEAEAKRHIPLPLSEVVWDWKILSKTKEGDKEKPQILLVATPRDILAQYQVIANQLNLTNFSIEPETFSLVRALAKEEKGAVAIIDIGFKTTSCSIALDGNLRISHSFDFSGDDMTERVAKHLGIDFVLAEKLKRKYGFFPTTIPEGKSIVKILEPAVNLIFREISYFLENFKNKEKKEVTKIILAGGEANLPGLLQFCQNYFKKEVELANPFKNIIYPKVLEKKLLAMGPTFSVVVGLAKRGLE